MRPWISTLFFNHRSLLPVQTLSICIGFLCITYLVLSNFSRLSITNIIPATWIQPIKINDKIILNLEQQEMQHVSRIENRSFICDRMRKNDGRRVVNFTSELDDHQLNILRLYCDIVPVPRSKWIPASRYVESDIVFIIHTSASFYHTRATAVRDTWASRVTHKYFFSETPYSSLPVTVIDGTRKARSSNIKKVYNGLEIAYKKHNGTAKFYFVTSCDTFVNVPHLLKRLDSFDYKQPLIIGGFTEKHKCYIKRNLVNYTISYSSSDPGFYLSTQMMKLIVPKLNSHFNNDWPLTEDNEHADAALNCLAHSMGIKSTAISGFWKQNPEQTLRDNGKNEFYADLEPKTFHNVHPLSMHVLDEFYVHQLLDRIGNDKDFDELMKFTRHFVNIHYQLLRIKQRECTLPTVEII
ncbi:unnamed protein product [Rotaria socialis]|uniref:N-acetylgalactosaminide beta-1,3-galactosyltransferase n=1 Tax=Rotaria socialis TaxID=392032 RepID=A0A821LLA9_9BILA|nr:unnamed protein product [Rotaria socialis]CAF4752802.1 unnamed protein product [Rotaria socialis]